MKTLFCFLVVLASLILSGCKPKEATVSGQIFIVTRGGESIKLGSVQVQIIEKQSLVEFLKQKQAAIDLPRERDVADATGKKDLDAIKAAIDAKYAPYPSTETYLDDFSPMAVRSVVSDADGKFSISYPREIPSLIYAKAERETDSGTEKYYWLLNAYPDADNWHPMLSNDNLISDKYGFLHFLRINNVCDVRGTAEN